jgi:hypothetical protein
LSEGINNKMSEVAAEQANKIRDCLEPARRQMLSIMSAQFGSATGNRNVQFLSPDEDKIMRTLAVTTGDKRLVWEKYVRDLRFDL